MEAADERALQSAEMGRCEAPNAWRSEQRAGCRGTERGEDGAGQRDTGALTNDAPGSQQAGCFALRFAGSCAHQSARVGRLEETLAKARQRESPDDVPDSTLRV